MPRFTQKLHYIDISYNSVSEWSFVDSLPAVFPGMTSLRFAHNPIYTNPASASSTSASLADTGKNEQNAMKTVEEGYMLTLARIAQLKSLNFSTITTADRTNAEMYYLSCIGKELASFPESQAEELIKRHPRYAELIKIYDEPSIIRKEPGRVNPNLLEARLIEFIFYIPEAIDGSQGKKKKIIEIPKTFDVYRVKGIVGRALGIPPLSLKLIWETGEWDPVAGYEDELEDDDNGPQSEDMKYRTIDTVVEPPAKSLSSDGMVKNEEERETGKWMKREVEIMDGTRQIGFWVDSMKASVRVERR